MTTGTTSAFTRLALVLAFSLAMFTPVFSQVLPPTADKVCPVLPGTKFPDVALTSADAKVVQSASLIQGKKTLVVVYRGGWCPFCTRHLAEVAQALPEIKAAGYQILAISGDAADKLKATSQKMNLSESQDYQLLADPQGNLAKSLGLAYMVPQHYEKTVATASNGANDGWLPAPALLVIDEKGTITFTYVNPDFKVRISKKLLLAAL